MKSLICITLAILITSLNGGQVVTFNSLGKVIYKNVKINGTLTVRPSVGVRQQ